MCKGSPRGRELYPAFDRKKHKGPFDFFRPSAGVGRRGTPICTKILLFFAHFLSIFPENFLNPLPSMNPRNTNGYVAKNVLVTMLVAGPSRSAAGKSGIDFLK